MKRIRIKKVQGPKFKYELRVQETDSIQTIRNKLHHILAYDFKVKFCSICDWSDTHNISIFIKNDSDFMIYKLTFGLDNAKKIYQLENI